MFAKFRIFCLICAYGKNILWGELIRETKKSFGLTEAF